MTKVFISPQPSQVSNDNGVGRVILAQAKHLPQHGIELVDNPDHADVIAAHISADGLPRVDVLHLHGLYFQDIPHTPYQRWHHEANRRIIEAARQALAITVPSEWVAMCFRRDMRLTPRVIGHGVDLEEWEPGENRGYVLWNKNRGGDVCDPSPAYELAKRGIPVISTFAPADYEPLPNFTVTGTLPHAEMRELVRHAGAYLATTKETFGIGTLEAMACGVRVVGYDWGGTSDIAPSELLGGTGAILVAPHDIDGLETACKRFLGYNDWSTLARRRAALYSWDRVMTQYAALFHEVAEQRRQEQPRVSVVITNYNYGAYLEEAAQSALGQTEEAHEVIIVDDGSTQDAEAGGVLDKLSHRYPVLRIARQENRGVAEARNVGVRMATGNLIICLDADDRLDRDYILKSLPHFKRRDVGIAYPRLRFLKDGELSPVQPFPPPFSWESQATPHNPPSNCISAAAMFRREMWERTGGYKQVYAPGEDAEFWTRGLSVGFKAVRSEAVYDYRVGHQSASRTKQYKAIDTWHPWMRDKQYPMAAPQAGYPLVRSYSEPTISVIIPVGPGHVKYLPAALDSLLGQTLRDWEAIIVDDTGEGILSEVLRPYPFCRIIKTLTTEGAGVARNTGIAAASAPLVLFLDADDFLAPEALAKMLAAFLDHESERYIYSDYVQFGESGAVARECAPYDQLGIIQTREHKGVIAPVVAHAITVLMPTEWAKDVQFPDWEGWEDWGFFSECATRGYCGYRFPEPLLYYRIHTGQRRERSISQAPRLLEKHGAAFGEYLSGAKKMCGCRGSVAGQTILRARSLLSPNGNGYHANGGGVMPLKDGQEGVRYIGGRKGTFVFQGVGEGRRYMVAEGWEASIGEGEGQVHPDDAERFKGAGGFEYVPAALPSPPLVHPSTPTKGQGGELESLEGIGPEMAAELARHGIESVADVRDAADEDLLAIPGIGDKTLESLREQTKKRGRKPNAPNA